MNLFRKILPTAALLAGLLIFAGCGTSDDGPIVDSGSHWLTMCESSDECGDYDCVCGVCTPACDSSDACGELPTDASCVAPEDVESGDRCASEPTTPAGMCLPECTADSDCPAADAALACIDGACLPYDTSDPPACTAADCGPAPGMPNFVCADGSMGGPACTRDAEGTCGWVIAECPEGCYGDDGCPEGSVCNAAEICLADPSCPECAVCYGYCVDPGSTDPCADDSDCPVGEICEAGVCSPGTCPGLWEPVCGVDGATYSNVCDARVNHVDVAYEGECEAAECTEDECGPAPGMPAVECADGSFAGPVCGRDAAGNCGWNITSCPSMTGCYGDDGCAAGELCTAAEICLQDPSCPECDVCYGYCVPSDRTCTRDECGPAPEAPSVLCEDGTLAGPICGRLGDACSWDVVACPEP